MLSKATAPMSCPFRALWGGPDEGQSQPKPPAVQSVGSTRKPGCPFAKLAVADAPTTSSASSSEPSADSVSLTATGDAGAAAPTAGQGPPVSSAAGSTGTCPFGFGAAAAAPQAAGSSAGAASNADPTGPVAEPAAAPGKCPYGFGQASNGPKLSELHCVLCRSLLFEAVTTNCGHIFCGSCAGRFSDCPVCGADIIEMKPNTELQGRVDQVLAAHADKMTVWELEGGRAQEGDAASNLDRDRATFFLHLGLRSLAGGNTAAAADRLGRAAQELSAALQGSSGADAAQLRCKLGSVRGSQGDCHRRLGSTQAAQRCYVDSIDLLREPAAAGLAEAAHALSVSLNKLGDLHYSAGHWAQAQQLYTEALQLRRQAWQQQAVDGGGSGAVQRALDVAVSLTKLADVQQQGGGGKDSAAALLEEAHQMAAAIETQIPDDDRALQSKFRSLLAALQVLGSSEQDSTQ